MKADPFGRIGRQGVRPPTAPELIGRPADEFRARAQSYPWMVQTGSTTLFFRIQGPIGRDDLPGLCSRVCALLQQSSPAVAICDVSGIDPDAVTVDALARLQLAARRHGCRVRLRDASPALLELVAFMGLTDVLPE